MARALALGHLIALATLAFFQIGLWKDATTLWTATAERDLGNVRANLWLGEKAYQQDRIEEADRRLATAFQRNSKHPKLLNSRGIVFARMGRDKEAVQLWQRAVQLWPGDPETANSRYLLEETRKRFPELFSPATRTR